MNSDVLLLATAGILALLSGALIVLLAPGGARALLAGLGLALLGLLQIGFARVAIDDTWGGNAFWFRTTISLCLPTTAIWVLLSTVIGKRSAVPLAGGWRVYLLFQAALSLGALLYSTRAPDLGGAANAGRVLDGATRAMLAIVLVNILLFAVRFEAAYLSLSRRDRRAFGPALLGIVVASFFFASLAAGGIVTGQGSISDVAVGAVPVTLLALVLPYSFIRGRVGTARIAPSQHPVTATTSFIFGGGFLAATAATFWLTHAAGGGTARRLWSLTTAGLIVGLATVVVSHRARRQMERLFAPLWTDWRAPYRAAVARSVAPLERLQGLEALCREIPESARTIARVESVTLLLAHRPSGTFRTVASTISPLPDASLGDRDPLPAELRRTRRPIRLHLRPDDLDLVSIHVENGNAISSCGARIAAPIWGESEMIGVLLCGRAAPRGRERIPTLPLLHLAAKHYATLIERAASTTRGTPMATV